MPTANSAVAVLGVRIRRGVSRFDLGMRAAFANDDRLASLLASLGDIDRMEAFAPHNLAFRAGFARRPRLQRHHRRLAPRARGPGLGR
jgi:hypothetical protein